MNYIYVVDGKRRIVAPEGKLAFEEKYPQARLLRDPNVKQEQPSQDIIEERKRQLASPGRATEEDIDKYTAKQTAKLIQKQAEQKDKFIYELPDGKRRIVAKKGRLGFEEKYPQAKPLTPDENGEISSLMERMGKRKQAFRQTMASTKEQTANERWSEIIKPSDSIAESMGKKWVAGGYTLPQVGLGIASVFRDIYSLATGKDDASKTVIGEGAEEIEAITNALNRDAEEMGIASKIVSSGVGGVSGSLPSMLLSQFIGTPSAVFLTEFFRNYSQEVAEGAEKNITDPNIAMRFVDSAVRASLSSVAETTLGKFGNRGGVRKAIEGMSKDEFKKFMADNVIKNIDNPIMKVVKAMGKGAHGEGLEEVFETVTNKFYDAIRGKETGYEGMDDKELLYAYMSDIGQSYAIGATAGVFMQPLSLVQSKVDGLKSESKTLTEPPSKSEVTPTKEIPAQKEFTRVDSAKNVGLGQQIAKMMELVEMQFKAGKPITESEAQAIRDAVGQIDDVDVRRETMKRFDNIKKQYNGEIVPDENTEPNGKIETKTEVKPEDRVAKTPEEIKLAEEWIDRSIEVFKKIESIDNSLVEGKEITLDGISQIEEEIGAIIEDAKKTVGVNIDEATVKSWESTLDQAKVKTLFNDIDEKKERVNKGIVIPKGDLENISKIAETVKNESLRGDIKRAINKIKTDNKHLILERKEESVTPKKSTKKPIPKEKRLSKVEKIKAEAGKQEVEVFGKKVKVEKGIPVLKKITPKDLDESGRQPVGTAMQIVGNKKTEREFARNIKAEGNFSVIELDNVQASHIYGERNPHYLTKMQRKDRTVSDSFVAYENAMKKDPTQLLIDTDSPYDGAINVNPRGEVIQGNNRAESIAYLYEKFPEKAELYKKAIVEKAKEYGFSDEQIAKIKEMDKPVLSNLINVDDEVAIKLGQYKQEDRESGGVRDFEAKAVWRMLDKDNKEKLTEKIGTYFTQNPDASIKKISRDNSADILGFLVKRGVIDDAQVKGAFSAKGELNQKGVQNLQELIVESVIGETSVEVREKFLTLPELAQGLIARLGTIKGSPLAGSMGVIISVFDRYYSEGYKSFNEFAGEIDINGKTIDDKASPLEQAIVEMLSHQKTEGFSSASKSLIKAIVEILSHQKTAGFSSASKSLISGISSAMYPEENLFEKAKGVAFSKALVDAISKNKFFSERVNIDRLVEGEVSPKAEDKKEELPSTVEFNGKTFNIDLAGKDAQKKILELSKKYNKIIITSKTKDGEVIFEVIDDLGNGTGSFEQYKTINDVEKSLKKELEIKKEQEEKAEAERKAKEEEVKKEEDREKQEKEEYTALLEKASMYIDEDAINKKTPLQQGRIRKMLDKEVGYKGEKIPYKKLILMPEFKSKSKLVTVPEGDLWEKYWKGLAFNKQVEINKKFMGMTKEEVADYKSKTAKELAEQSSKTGYYIGTEENPYRISIPKTVFDVINVKKQPEPPKTAIEEPKKKKPTIDTKKEIKPSESAKMEVKKSPSQENAIKAYGSLEKKDKAVKKVAKKIENDLKKIKIEEIPIRDIPIKDFFKQPFKSEILEGFKESKDFEIMGLTVNNFADLYTILQVHRSPYIEKAHIIYLDENNKVIGNQIFTLGMVDRTITGFEFVEEGLITLNPKSFYIAHNHPSGNIIPSSADKESLMDFYKNFKDVGFKGSMILDHNKYAELTVDEGGKINVENKDIKDVATPTFTKRYIIDNAEDYAKIGKALTQNSKNNGAIMFLSGARINEIQLLPSDYTQENYDKEVSDLIIKGVSGKVKPNNIFVFDRFREKGISLPNMKGKRLPRLKIFAFDTNILKSVDSGSYGRRPSPKSIYSSFELKKRYNIKDINLEQPLLFGITGLIKPSLRKNMERIGWNEQDLATHIATFYPSIEDLDEKDIKKILTDINRSLRKVIETQSSREIELIDRSNRFANAPIKALEDKTLTASQEKQIKDALSEYNARVIKILPTEPLPKGRLRKVVNFSFIEKYYYNVEDLFYKMTEVTKDVRFTKLAQVLPDAMKILEAEAGVIVKLLDSVKNFIKTKEDNILLGNYLQQIGNYKDMYKKENEAFREAVQDLVQQMEGTKGIIAMSRVYDAISGVASPGNRKFYTKPQQQQIENAKKYFGNYYDNQQEWEEFFDAVMYQIPADKMELIYPGLEFDYSLFTIKNYLPIFLDTEVAKELAEQSGSLTEEAIEDAYDEMKRENVLRADTTKVRQGEAKELDDALNLAGGVLLRAIRLKYLDRLVRRASQIAKPYLKENDWRMLNNNLRHILGQSDYGMFTKAFRTFAGFHYRLKVVGRVFNLPLKNLSQTLIGADRMTDIPKITKSLFNTSKRLEKLLGKDVMPWVLSVAEQKSNIADAYALTKGATAQLEGYKKDSKSEKLTKTIDSVQRITTMIDHLIVEGGFRLYMASDKLNRMASLLYNLEMIANAWQNMTTFDKFLKDIRFDNVPLPLARQLLEDLDKKGISEFARNLAYYRNISTNFEYNRGLGSLYANKPGIFWAGANQYRVWSRRFTMNYARKVMALAKNKKWKELGQLLGAMLVALFLSNEFTKAVLGQDEDMILGAENTEDAMKKAMLTIFYNPSTYNVSTAYSPLVSPYNVKQFFAGEGNLDYVLEDMFLGATMSEAMDIGRNLVKTGSAVANMLVESDATKVQRKKDLAIAGLDNLVGIATDYSPVIRFVERAVNTQRDHPYWKSSMLRILGIANPKITYYQEFDSEYAKFVYILNGNKGDRLKGLPKREKSIFDKYMKSDMGFGKLNKDPFK